MTNDHLKSIPIEYVHEIEYEDTIVIFFSIKKVMLRIIMIKTKKGSCYPYYVSHVDYPGKCTFCSKDMETTWRCEELSPHIPLLLPRVLQSHAIRLNWLYREYEVE